MAIVLYIGIFVVVFVVVKRLLAPAAPSAAPRQSSKESVTVSEAPSRRAPPTPPIAPAQWRASGSPIDIGGYRINGMVYFGSGLRSVKGGGIEPALIDPALRISTPTDHYNGEDLSYWPGYDHISPQARGRYLAWLEGGRKDPEISVGFVFLFFYGLERRLLIDQPANDEKRELIAEIERLRGLYTNASFKRYSGGLLDILRVMQSGEGAEPPVLPEQPGYDSLALRVGLGHCALSGAPIPATWALAWAEAHPDYRRRTPAERCRNEFEQLFSIEFLRRFPDGCKLKPNKRTIRFEYLPASASFGHAITHTSDIPDVAALKEPGETLKTIAMSCTEQLDAHSRYLGKHPETRDSLAALVLLPAPLLRVHTSVAIAALREWVNAALREPYALVDATALWAHWPDTDDAKPGTKRTSILLAQLLGSLDAGIEPDPRFGNSAIEVSGTIVLFRLGEDRPTIASTSYMAASMLLTLATTVARADNKVTQDEELCLEQQIRANLDLSPGEELRLRAQMRWLLATDINLNSVKKRLEALPIEKRELAAKFLVDVANADGEISPPEIDTLMKIYGLLGLDPKKLFSAAHAAATEPVFVQMAGAVSEPYAIPARNGSVRTGIDMRKVAAMNSESERVSALLRDIFSEENVTTNPAALPVSCLFGLDGARSRFFEEFVQKSQWRREDLESLATECDVLLEGTLDVINDLALERCDDALFDGEDPVEINESVARELMNERHQTAGA